MEMLTLAHAKKYADSKQLAYEEPAVMGKVFECIIPAGQNNIEFDVPVAMNNFKFESGATYPVTINGKTVEARYDCGEACHFYGDPYFELWGSEYVGQPYGSFHIEAYDPNGQGIAVARHITIDIDVVVKEAVVHTIDPKYLPKGGVGYEEVNRNYYVKDLVIAGEETPYPDGTDSSLAGKNVRMMFNGEVYTFHGTPDGYSVCSDIKHPANSNQTFSITLWPDHLTVSDASELNYDWKNCGLTVSLYDNEEVIVHTIEPKYLPGVCLPVIEVESTSVTTLTEEQNAVLLAAAEAGTPVVLRINRGNRGRGSYVLYLEAYYETGNIRYFANLNGQYYSGYVWLNSEYTDGQRNGFTMTFNAGA